MRLFLFGASIFYLLGLKLMSHIEVKSPISSKPEIIKSQTFPEIKENAQPLELKPGLIKKDSTISAGTKSLHPKATLVKPQKNHGLPLS